MTNAELSPTRGRIIAAAEGCFRSQGLQRTTISDVALGAGVTRKTVYRLFGDRQGLIVAILNHRFRDVLEALRARLPRYVDFVEAIVEGPLYAMQRLHADPIFRDLLASETTHGVDLILSVDREVDGVLQDVWAPVYAQARRDGVLRSGLSDARLIEGAGRMAGMLILRTDLDLEGKRQFLKDFLAPALVGLDADRDPQGKKQGEDDSGEDARRVPVRRGALHG